MPEMPSLNNRRYQFGARVSRSQRCVTRVRPSCEWLSSGVDLDAEV